MNHASTKAVAPQIQAFAMRSYSVHKIDPKVLIPSCSHVADLFVMPLPGKGFAALLAAHPQQQQERGGSVGSAADPLWVSARQRGNPVLQHLRDVRWSIREQQQQQIADFEWGGTSGALFISLRFHAVHPTYIRSRFATLANSFQLRLLLCLVDVEAPAPVLRELSCLALQHGWSLICTWSAAEAARFLETFKQYERAPHDLIMDHAAEAVAIQPMQALQVIRAVNKTDIATLASTFGSIARLSSATVDALATCPGIGPKKANQIHDLFHQRWS